MKLRNKHKPNIIGYIEQNLSVVDPITNELLLTVRYKDNSGFNCYTDYKTIKEFNEDWEDYEPIEPLIKDEKIRNVVKEWAKLNWSHELHQYNNYQLEDENNFIIEFAEDCFTNLEVDKNYTIAELCGEEEE